MNKGEGYLHGMPLAIKQLIWVDQKFIIAFSGKIPHESSTSPQFGKFNKSHIWIAM